MINTLYYSDNDFVLHVCFYYDLENDDIFNFPYISFDGDNTSYYTVDEDIERMSNLDAALLRLESECEAIYEFNQSIQTPEQKHLAERLVLKHDGKKMCVDPASQEPYGCFGCLYNKDTKICNLSCGVMKDCIHKTKELKRRIRKIFPTKYTTILKLLREYGQENGV